MGRRFRTTRFPALPSHPAFLNFIGKLPEFRVVLPAVLPSEGHRAPRLSFAWEPYSPKGYPADEKMTPPRTLQYAYA